MQKSIFKLKNKFVYVIVNNLIKIVYFKSKPKEETKPAKKDNELFHSVSSIPLVHIPDDELKIYAKSWPKNVSLTRHSNLNNTYDSLTKQMWNHI